MSIDLEPLKAAVQANCDRVDAVSAQNYGLCIYLMKMWEYYRWRNGLSLTAEIANEAILTWIAELEEYWEGLEGDRFQVLRVGEHEWDPFATHQINRVINPLGYVYSGGVGYGGIPSFCLARLEAEREVEGFRVLVASTELSRGLYGFPAMLLDETVFVRKEALKSLIWSRFEEWRPSRRDNMAGRAFSHYAFESDADRALAAMTAAEVRTLTLHEAGEGLLDRHLGEVWREMLIDFANTKTEVIARAARDLAADCLMTLPKLLEAEAVPSLQFYFANFSDMRKALYPELYAAFLAWADDRRSTVLIDRLAAGGAHWSEVCRRILVLYRAEGRQAAAAIKQLTGQ